ncbi:MAG TPA: gamma-glutamylcyclotransferase [Alphaproteobacteria bacterium]|nr:gamma-glutamylcyclotransferase [Alphaproteobacteria bacterium]
MWVFGYGSLLWNPGFEYELRAAALLRGYHRAFCIVSHRHRGTKEIPGLVLGLAPGGSCLGRAYRVADEKVDDVMAYLDDREMPDYVYLPRRVPVRLYDEAGRLGGRVSAHTYVADVRQTDRCLTRLTLEETAVFIRRAHGQRGPNTEYLANTIAHLDELGIKEGRLHALQAIVQRGG